MPIGPECVRYGVLFRAVLRVGVLLFGILLLRDRLLPVGVDLHGERRVLSHRTVPERQLLLPIRLHAMRTRVLSERSCLLQFGYMRLSRGLAPVHVTPPLLFVRRKLHRRHLLVALQRPAADLGHDVHLADRSDAVPTDADVDIVVLDDFVVDHVILHDVDDRVPSEWRRVHDRKSVLLAELLRRAVRSRRLHLTARAATPPPTPRDAPPRRRDPRPSR